MIDSLTTREPKNRALCEEAALTVKQRATAGFSLIELLLVISIAAVLTAIAIPGFMNALKSYRFTAAVAATTGAIHSTRFQAIMRGYPYRLAITASTMSYQVYSKAPPATSFSAVGLVVPIARVGDVTISQDTTLQFSANGTVSATVGSMAFTMTNGIVTKTLTVSGVGNVSVTP